jgi:maleylacetoacetate isomerase/maleylpyruvate isomerase
MSHALTLWGYWRSSTSYRTRIALNLKRLRYDYRPINLKLGEQKGEDYRAVNPHGTVPLFQDGDVQMTQSLAILDWLEARYPDPSFVPDTGAELCRDLYYAVATEVHAPNNLAVLQYLKREFNADQAALEAWYATWIIKTFAPVEERLRAHKWASDELPFGQPTLFEIVLIPQIYNARRWKTDLIAFPLLAKIDAHCATLEAFDRARPETQIDAN